MVDYPIHRIDDTNILKDLSAESDTHSWKSKSNKKNVKQRENKKTIETAYEVCKIDGDVTLKMIAEYMEKSEKTIRNYVNSSSNLYIKNGFIYEK